MTLHYTKIFSTLLGRYMPKLSKIVITLKFYQLHTKISILTETAFLVKRGNYSNKLKNLLNLFTNSLNFTFQWEIPNKGNSKHCHCQWYCHWIAELSHWDNFQWYSERDQKLHKHFKQGTWAMPNGHGLNNSQGWKCNHIKRVPGSVQKWWLLMIMT